MAWLTFMKEVILENKTTGALGPSSKELAVAITSLANLSESKVIVEYGSGDGVLRRKSDVAKTTMLFLWQWKSMKFW